MIFALFWGCSRERCKYSICIFKCVSLTNVSNSYQRYTYKNMLLKDPSWSILFGGAFPQTKHMKPRTAEEAGQIIQREAPIHHSNVMLYSKEKSVRSRVAFKCVVVLGCLFLFRFTWCVPSKDSSSSCAEKISACNCSRNHKRYIFIML